MAIDPLAAGRPSVAHVSLVEARALVRGGTSPPGSGSTSLTPGSSPPPSRKTARSIAAQRAPAGGKTTARQFNPHTAVTSNANADPDQWDAMLNRLGKKYNVPPLFLKAVMLSESGGRPDAIGDQGHSVGLFQLHDHGYGAGMGDTRFDPETNADRGARGLAEAWHAGEKAGYTGEYAVRAAYNYSFNPGGGWAYQGDSVVRNYNQLLAEQGLPALA
jgi:soluble lytic murein transglycosylase-like protein